IARAPLKFERCSTSIGNKNWWISLAARANLNSDWPTGDAFRDLDNFADAQALSRSQIVYLERFRLIECVNCPDVSIGQVGNVDVVSDIGAIWSVVVIAKNGHRLTEASCRLQNYGYKMRLGIMIFTDLTVRISAGSVEIAECYRFKPIR